MTMINICNNTGTGSVYNHNFRCERINVKVYTDNSEFFKGYANAALNTAGLSKSDMMILLDDDNLSLESIGTIMGETKNYTCRHLLVHHCKDNLNIELQDFIKSVTPL